MNTVKSAMGQLHSGSFDRKTDDNRFFPLKLKGKDLETDKRTLVMGVINVTPDSFYRGSRSSGTDKSLSLIAGMVEQGADIIDIGAESTRPSSKGVSAEQELERIIPVVEEAVKNFDVTFSVDTTKSVVAEEVLSRGVSIINDISGLRFDPAIAEVVARHNAGVVLMHTPSRPSDMQKFTEYDSLINDIREYLGRSLQFAIDSGIDKLSTVLDPGIGFGKTAQQNLTIINNLDKFLVLRRPLMVGTSRKSFIGKILGDIPAEERLEGTLATIAVSILRGASIVRVHDVREAKMASAVADAICSS